jgi:hypothetical protein
MSQFHITCFILKYECLLNIAIYYSFFKSDSVDWSGRRRLQREQRELKAPEERSDEEIEAVSAESVRLERKSTLFGLNYIIFFMKLIQIENY